MSSPRHGPDTEPHQTARKRRTIRARTSEPAGSRDDAPPDSPSLPPLARQSISNTPRRATDSIHSDHPDESIHAAHTGSSFQYNSPNSRECPTSRQSQPDLLYLNILQETVNDTVAGQSDAQSTPAGARPENGLNWAQHWNKPAQLDDVDNEYLAKKKVFDLPPAQYMDTIIKTYFDHVYPFAPILNRTDFVQNYRSGNCSPFLLHSISAATSLYVPIEVISGCGFADRSAAQTSFFTKANLLHQFHCGTGSLSMLQGSIILGTIILDHPCDRDFQYWFHNSVRLAIKLGVRHACLRNDGSEKMYRRIWWVLYTRDVFHLFVNTQNLRLLRDAPLLKPLTEDDWELEDITESLDLLSPISHQQKASFIMHCESAQIFGHMIPLITTDPKRDPRELIQPLDTWRASLPDKMRSDHPFHDGEFYLLDVLTTSYRFECIMCRLLRRGRWQVRDVGIREWAQQRFRSAIFELDTISKRVLVNDTIHKLPMSFITTIPALLALHIESALDSSEPELVQSMARISIQQTMLALHQLQETPAIKRALPAFEMVLSRNKLYPAVLSDGDQSTLQPVSTESTMDGSNTLSQAQSDSLSFPLDQNEHPFSYGDFLGFDFLDRWQMEQLDFTGIY
ncbi:hypothetical protein FSARC_13554 [Fusarium sarcochroum]|uniref:Xylanolytic transcriptional activator regulatory domain-containing protein n=1 Tax=Fusarium sarcochroum TaxID=1208366 RepID=A0A8H4WSK7_9HYPO|nr:hypothetical protein FSARC_13554 [Fusarium sarcochroum]